MFFLLSSLVFSRPTQERILDQDATTVLSFRPNTIWRHAANLSFFTGQSYQLSYSQQEMSTALGYSSISDILGFGVSYYQEEEQTWWNTATALAIPISSNIGAGIVWGWHSPSSPTERYNSFHTADLSLSFRPFHFLGFSAGTRNLGSPHSNITTEYYSGVGLRTFSGALCIGADWTIMNDTNLYEGNLTLQPLSGLELRLKGDSTGSWVGGVAIKGSLGYLGTSYSPNRLNVQFVHKTPNRGMKLSTDRVALFSLNRSYPYQSKESFLAPPKESYLTLLHRVREAANAQDIRALFFRTQGISLSYAQLQEIAQELRNARNTGKEVIMYLEGEVDTKSYFLASFADKIMMHPAANFSVVGIFSERMYLRGLLDLIGITPEVVRRSAYKSSPEQFTHTQSSPASQEQTQELLSSLFSRITQSIAKNRDMTDIQVQEYIDRAPYSAQKAKDLGFIDELHYPDELEDLMDDWFDSPQEIDDYGTNPFSDGWEQRPEIAILYANGIIVSGSSQTPGLLGGMEMIGSQTLIKQIKESIDDDNIRAVVLRVDSPGGSAFASEEMWRALQLLKREKPLIISMGGVAASGGYYIATAGDRIFAEPTTITGSIGVYVNRFHLEKVYELFGIGVESTSMGNHAGIYKKSKAWSQSEREKMEELVEDTYRLFKTRVAEGRSLSAEQVEEVAQGRVWSGRAAKEQNLVDEMGGIYEAILHAKLKAGIKGSTQIRLRTFSSTQNGGLSLTQGIKQQISDQLVPQSVITQLNKEITPLKRDKLWTILPYYLSIQ